MSIDEKEQAAPPNGARLRWPAWTFLSNHGHVLLTIAADPDVRLRDLAARIGITPRAVQRIVADLIKGHYLERQREGRCNRYRIHPEIPMRHPLVAHHVVGELLKLLTRGQSDA